MKTLRSLARSLAQHARIGKLARYMNDLPANRLVTVGTIAAELGEEADWIQRQFASWLEEGWLHREPVEFGYFGYRGTELFPPVDFLDATPEAIYGAILSAAITAEAHARQ